MLKNPKCFAKLRVWSPAKFLVGDVLLDDRMAKFTSLSNCNWRNLWNMVEKPRNHPTFSKNVCKQKSISILESPRPDHRIFQTTTTTQQKPSTDSNRGNSQPVSTRAPGQLGVVLRGAAACVGCAGYRPELRKYGICHAGTLGGGMVGWW